MAFGFPAYHSSNISLNNPAEDKKKAVAALEHLGWKIFKNNDKEISASNSISLWSWGESIKLEFNNEKLFITSKCSLPTQCIDWGKNKRNVNAFLKFFNA